MFWKTKFPVVSSLDNNQEMDIAIIGGGITGLTTAYYLKDTNKRIALFDKGKIGCGITSNTTGKITYLQGDIYQKLGKAKGREYYSSQKYAIDSLLKIISCERIDCDLEKVPMIVFTSDIKNVDKIDREKELIEEFGSVTFPATNEKIKSGMGANDYYNCNPLQSLARLTRVLKNKISFYEDTMVFDMKKEEDYYVIRTAKGDFKAKKVVIACFYPFFIIPNFFPLKNYIQREYVNVARVKKKYDFSAINIDEDLHSIRFYKNFLIYGSNRHRLTSEIDYGKHYQKSKDDFTNFFGVEPEFTWMNQDIVSHDLLPFIGKINSSLFLGVGYRGWGMTNGTLAGKIIADNILGYENSFDKLFSPGRIGVSLFVNSFLGTFHYMKVYAQSLWKKNNPSYIRFNGFTYAFYKDKEHKIHKIKLLCPHMKCHLVFNSYEKTWDCPCHGSRFDLDGNVICGPAKENLLKE